MTHNLSKTRLYSIYTGMKQRCYNKNNPLYKYYGGKGITICNEWLNHGVQNFIEWSLSNGYNENLTIDRIDSTKGYTPDNCRWITLSFNASKNNTIKFPIKDIKVIEKKIPCLSIQQRIGMARAYKGISQAELARSIGMTPSNFNQKLKRETFTSDELTQIAVAIGATYHFGFEFPDGTKI